MANIRARAALALTLSSVLTLALAAPTLGTIFERGQFAGTDTFSYECDGFDVAGEVEFAVRFHLRTGKGANDDAFFQHDTFRVTEIHTHSETGQVLIVSGHGVNQEVKATRVDGSVFEFTSIQAGQPLVVRDEAGNLLLRDRGVIRFVYLFDTLGDDVPGGEFIADVDVQVRGPHPGFFIDICSLFD